jgi:hypothetical protein
MPVAETSGKDFIGVALADVSAEDIRRAGSGKPGLAFGRGRERNAGLGNPD